MKTTWFVVISFFVVPALAQSKGNKAVPEYVPNITHGSKLYMDNCSVCHGSKGLSDSVVGSTLKKKPTPIGDPEVLNRLSPQKVFHVLTKGISDAGMPSYRHLSDTERWDIAAFIFTLNCNFQKPVANVRASLSWNEAKAKTDSEIVEVLRRRSVPDVYVLRELAAIRTLLE